MPADDGIGHRLVEHGEQRPDEEQAEKQQQG